MLKNASNTDSTFNNVKFDTKDSHDQYLLYSPFVTWYCKGSSIAPLSDYANNLVFQELPTKNEYSTNAVEKIFIDQRRGKVYSDELEKSHKDDSNLKITTNLKTASIRKMRLQVIGYFQGEYFGQMVQCSFTN